MGVLVPLPARRRSCPARVRAAAALAALLAAGVAVADAQPAPGGVTDQNSFLIWLKANAGTSTTSDNAPVVTWSDQSPVHGNNDASQTISTNSRPLFQKDTGNLINFNPVLSFDSNNDYLRIFLDVAPPNRNPLSTAIVYRPTTGGGLYGNDNTGWDLAHDTSYVAGNNSSVSYPGGDTTGLPVINGAFFNHGVFNGSSVFINNREVADFTYDNATNAHGYLDIGVTGTPCTPCGTFFGGAISEFILYSRQLTSQERRRVDSYLAIKYGVTLNQSSATDYLHSGGAVIWDATANRIYRNNITGIGRDDNSALVQKQSRSVQDDSLVTMGLGTIAVDNISNASSFSTDRTFLVWGNDDRSTTFATPVTSPPGLSDATRMARIWKVQETGSVATVKVGVPATTGPPGPLYLVVSDNETFSGSDQWIAMTPFSAGTTTYRAADFNFTNGQFFTFATAEPLDLGDAPASYGTLLANDGARHTVEGYDAATHTATLMLGTTIDVEADGQPDAAATGDDVSDIDDEDGVVFSPLVAGQLGFASVRLTGPRAHLHAWADWNNNGRFTDAGELIVNLDVNAALAVVGFLVPVGTSGPIAFRFRLSTVMGLGPTGPAPDGEVEDYVVTVGRQVDLAITKTDNQVAYVPGAAIAYTLTVNNFGPSTAAGFSIADVVPAAITGVVATCAVTGSGSCGSNGTSGNSVSFTNANLPAGTGQALTITITGTVGSGTTGNLVNTATVSVGAGQTDTAAGNNSATDTDTQGAGVADLEIAKTDGQSGYVAGTPISYTLTVTNAGPSSAAPLNVTDAVPASITGVTASCTAVGTATCGTNTSAGNNVAFTGASVSAGAGHSLTITISGTVGPGTTGTLINTAHVTVPGGAPYSDPSPANNSATDSDAPGTPVVDLAITKTDGKTAYVPGAAITYTLEVTNAGPSTASGLSVADAVPAALTGVGATCVVQGLGSCGSNGSAGNGVSFTNATLAPGGGNALSIAITGTVSPATTGALTNIATVTRGAGTTEANTANNSATDIDTQGTGLADLAITKTNGQSSYVAGASVTYTLTIMNAGPSHATAFDVSDLVPAAIADVTVSCTPSGTASCGTNASAGNNVAFTSASLNAGAGHSLTITINGTIGPDTTGSLTNTAQLTVPPGAGYTDPAPGNNTASDTDTAQPQQVDLAITKSDGQTSYVPGAPIRYTLVVTNAGPSTATDVRVADTVPAAITGVVAHCVATGLARCGTAGAPGNSVTLTNASLPPGAGNRLTLTIDGTVSPDSTGDLVNTAVVTAAAGAVDTAPANNTAADTDTQGAGVADLVVSKTDGTAVYTPGLPITYQIVVANDGPSHAAGFAIDDVVPAAITGVAASCVVTTGAGTCGSNDTAGNTVAFSGVTLTARSTLTVTVTGTIDPAATGDLANTATVTVPGGAGFTDPDPTSNAATDIDTLGSQLVDLAITKDDGQTTYVPGTPISYTVTVANAGPSTATDVSLSDELPAAITNPSVTCVATGTANCGSRSTVRSPIGSVGASLPPGTTLTITIAGTIAPDATGDLVNTATVAAGSGATDTDPANNSATDIDTPAPPQVDLAVVKDDGQTIYVPGTPISYTITVTNAGPSTANGVSLTDTVPAAITDVTVDCAVTGTGSCGTDGSAGNSVSFTNASLAPGPAHALTVTVSGTVSPSATGTLVNTATVTAGAGSTDTSPVNNSATDADAPGIAQVDLGITKTDGQESYVPGTPISYTLTVTNAGPSAANGFSISDVVPAAITGVMVQCVATGTDTCGINGSSGNSISFTNASLAAGAGHALTLTVSGNIAPDAIGALVNTATVTSGAGSTDANPANDSAIDTDTRDLAQVDLAITKSDGQLTYVPGTAITYTIGVTNAGPSTATGFSITDAVPAAITGVTASCAATGGGVCGTNGSLRENVVFNNASLPPGAGTLTLTVHGTIGPSTSGAIENTATVTEGVGSVDVNTANDSATDIDTPGTSQIDLAVTKTDGRTTYVPGAAITYTIAVTNAGPSAANGFSVTDTVPPAITGVTATCAVTGMASCGPDVSPSGNAVSFAGLSVAPGTGNAITLTVTGTVSPDATGDLTNTATATADAGSTDANAVNNSATDTDTQGVSQVNLAIAKDNGQTAYVPGTPTTYSITVTNAGPSTATGITIADPVPAAITGVTATCAVTGTGSCGTNASAGNNVSFTGAMLPPGAGQTLTLTVSGNISPDASGPLVNAATVAAGPGSTDPSPGNDTASDTDTLGATQVDLAITKTDGQETYVPGTPITYTIAVTNAGPSHAGSVTITDQVPAAITGITTGCLVTGSGACGTDASSGNAVSFTNASLAPGAGNVVTITVSGTVSPGASGPLSNTATVAAVGATDTNPGNNSATDTNSPGTSQANLGITKAGPASVLPGGTVNYTLTVSNAGPSDALDVTVSDPTPSGLTFVSNAGDCTTAFSCTLGALPVGATRTITATFDVPPGYTSPAPIVNTATVSSTATDPDATNDSATASTALVRDADVEVTKSAPANVLAGQTIDVTVSVLNHGPNGATGVEVRDVLPPGFQFVADAPTQGVYDPGSGIWTVGALAVSASAQLVITATATEPGSITNLAVKTGQNEPDPNPANDSGGSTTNVAAAADLAIDTSVDRADALVGETVTFTVRAINRGPSPATGVTITGTLTPGLTILSATPSQGTFAGGLWTVGALDASAEETLTLVTRLDAAGAQVTNANVAAQVEFDPNPLNDNDAALVNAAAAADLRVTKAVSNPAPGVGALIAYTVEVTNLGPSAATSATILDVLPGNVSYVTASASQGTYDPGTGVWTVGALPVTATETLTILVRVTAAGAATNTATRQASAPVDPNPANDSDSATATPALIADLAIAKALMTAPIPGLAATYTIAVRNNGPSPVVGATVTDTFPPALLGVTWTCTADPGSVCPASGTGNLAATIDLEARDQATFTVSGTLASGVTGVLANTATVVAPAGVTDPDAANNTATSTVTLTPIADMQVTKTGPTQATPGTNLTYTITATNAGPSDATGVVLNDVTPPGLTLVSVSGDCSRGFPCPVEPTFVAGASRTFTLTYAVPSGYTTPNPIANTVTASSATTDPQSGNNTATATTSLGGPVTDLGITKTNGVTTVVPGQTVTYTITVTNAGPTNAVGAHVTDVFPAALTGVTWTCVGTGGGVCTPAGSGPINESVTVPVGGTVTFTVTGTVSAAAVGVLVNTATVTPPPGASDPSSANNTDSDTLTPQADVQVTKTGPASVVAGANVVYTIRVTNPGPSNAESVVVADVTPAGLTWVSNAGDCVTAFPCALGTVAAGSAARVIAATFAVPLSYTTPDPIANTATVSTATTDPLPANDTATVQTPLNRNADVEVTKTAPETVLVGDTVAIAITMLNHGPGAATGIEVTDVLPAGFTYVSDAPGQGVYDPGTGVWTVGALALDGQAQLVITATATSPGAITNVAVKTGQNEPDPNPSNDSGGTITSTAPAADVLVVKHVDRSDVLVGEGVTFTVRAINRGPSPATGVVIADALPPGLTLITPTASQGTYAGGVWTVGSLAAPAVATLTLLASVDATGALVNNAAVTAQDQADPDPLNNSDAASVNASAAADLRVTKAVSDAAPAVGGLLTYTIAVTNLGPSAATSVVISDVLPASVTFVSATPSQDYDPVSGLWTVGAMPATGTQTLSITGRVTALGPVTNTATRQASTPIDPNPLNDSASATVTPQLVADLAITKTPSAATVAAGAPLTWTLVVTNAGPSTATDATVTDNFGLAFTGVTWTCTATAGSSCGVASGVGAIATTVTLVAGGRATFVATTLVAASAIGPQANTATVTAPAGTTDLQPTNNSVTATVEVTASADLQITKTGPASVVPGTNVVYTITVTNAGPSDAASVVVTDTTPAGLTFVSNAGDCLTAFPCALGTVPAGAPRVITTTFAVPASYTTPDPLVNTAAVATATTDPVAANNTATVQTPVTRQADLAITKTGPASVVAGSNVVYTITVTNAGPSDAESVVVADATPAGLTFVSNTGDCVTAFPCALGTVPAGAPPRVITATFAVPASFTTPNPLVNTATVSAATGDPLPANNTATAQTSIAPQADVAITKTGPASVVPGTNVVYTITVTNTGPSDAASVVVADAAPTGLAFVSNAGDCVTAFPCTLGTVAAGAPARVITATFAVPVTYTAPDPIVNTATVSTATADPVATNNTATAQTAVTLQADLAIMKTGPASVVAGTNVVYTITVTNAGPSAADSVIVADATPAGLTFVSNAGDCLTAFPCALGTVPAGAAPLTITATFEVPLGYTTPDPIANTASVSTTTADPISGNNTVTVETPLNRNADVEVTKTAPQSVLVGDTVAIAITAFNHGPGAATGVEVTDVLPAGFSYVSSAPVGVYDPGTGVWTVGALALDGQAQLVITAAATSPGAITNVAVKTGQTEPDPNPNNDSGGTITSTAPAADVLVVKNVDRSNVLVGETVTFTVRAVNRGPSPATGVAITDALPAGLTLITPTPSQGTYAGGVWTVGTLAAPAVATLTLEARVDAPGALVNNAAITAQVEADPDQLNNSDAASVNASAAADLRVTKAVSDPAPAVGGLLTYTIAVTNLGPSAATSVTISDVLPASVAFVSATPSQAYDPVSGLWAVGDLPATGTQTLSITVRVLALVPVTNTASRQTSAPVDPNPLNDSASAAATPQLVADLAITKTPSAATVNAGAPLVWTIAVTNAGPSTATDAPVTDTFAPAFTGVTWTCTATAGSSCAAASGVGAITTTVTLLSGGGATFVATTLVAASAIGPQANTATVTAPAGTTDLQLTNNSVTATVEVTASADVAIAKTGPASVVPGTNVVYTITVTNTGPSDAASVVVDDATPTGLTFVSNTGDCLTAFPCALGTVAAGAAPRVIMATFTVPATYTTPDPLMNAATVATTTVDPVAANNTATLQTPVAAQADLAITKIGPAAVVPGTNVVYTITVTNAGPSDAANVAVADATPAGLTFVSTAGDCLTAFPCALGTVPAGAPPRVITATFTVPATYTTPDPIVNTATVSTATTDPVPNNNTATAQTAVTLQADLAITKTGPASAVPGTNVVYTIAVTNAGPSDAASVVVTDATPAGLTWVSNAGDCVTAFPCTLGTVAAGAPAQVITAAFAVPPTYTTPDPIVNTATVSTATTDPVSGNNTATVQTPLNRNADVEVTKTAPETVLVGDTVAIAITAFNHGPGAATGVEVTDVLPAGFTYVSQAPTQGVYDDVTGVWTVGALALNGQAQLVITATATSPGAITNVAVKTGQNEPDPNTNNDSGGTITSTAPAADVLVLKNVDRSDVLVGESVTFTVRAINRGPSPATGVAITDALPPGLTLISQTPSQGTTYDGSVWTVGSLAAPAVATLTLVARVDAPGALVNNAAVTGQTEADPDPLNNSDAASVNASAAADLRVTKAVSDPAPAVGGLVTYTIAVTNLGPSAATSVTISDVLPASVAFVSATPSQAYDAGTGLWTVGDLPATATQTLSITGRVTALGAVTNTASRQASAPVDPNPLNDSASATATPQLVADLAITKTPSAATVNAGAPLIWTITVTNAGPSTATDATVNDTFGPAFTGVTWTCTATAGSSCGAPSGVGAIATTVTLLAGGRATFVANTLIASSAIGPQANTATVTAPAGTTEPQAANNSQTATVQVTASADVAITKSGPASVVPGTNVVYTITVTNAGPSAADSVVVADETPTGLTFVSNTGACVTAFPCAIGTVAAGAPAQVITATFTVPATYTSPNPILNTATVSSATPDTVPANNTAAVQTSVDRNVDLRVTKAGPPSAAPGTAVDYTITVTNAGASDALDAVVDDPTPAGLTWTSNTGDCVTAFPCALGLLSAGATRTITAAFAIPPDYATPDPIVNTATVSSATPDAVPGDNTATASTAVGASADIALTKSVDRPGAAMGEAVAFTVTATNEGPSGSTGLQVLDSLPAGLSFDSAAPSQGTYDAVSGVWTPGALANGASAILTINARVTGPTPIVNMAVRLVSDQVDPNGGNDAASAVITPLPVADVQITKTADRTTVPVGEVVTFTVSAVNAGPNDATGVRVVDLLPAGLVYVSATPSAGTYEPSTGTWTLGTLATGGTSTLQIVATVAADGAHTNVAQRMAQNEMDPVALNDMSGVTVNGPSADLQVLKTVTTRVPGVATVGERVRFTVSVTNRGPDDATNVRVLDVLPPGLTFAGAVASQGTYTAGAGVWDVGALAASGAASLATLTVDADVAEPIALVNTASRLGADQVDPNRLNDRAMVTITGVPADLQLALTSEGNPAAAGGTIDFIAAFTNVAAADVSGPITVTFSIPAESVFESADAGWTCTVLGQEVSCVRADLVVAPGASGQARIRTRLLASVVGRWVSASVVNALDANPANNTATIPLNAPPPAAADVQVTLAATLPTLRLGDTTALTATVVDAGPSTARATSLALSVPAGFALDGVDAGPASCTGTGPVACQFGDLANGAQAQVTLRLRATALGLSSASASVATAVDDPDLTNNAATLALIVGLGGDSDGDRIPDTCEGLFGLIVGVDDAAGDADGDGISNLEECLNGTHPRGFHRAYFAEGASGGGFFDSTFTIANESTTSAASVTIRLVPETGPAVTRPLIIGVHSRATILARDLLGEAPVTFSALIESDLPISSERTMTWDAATHYGSHSEHGLEQPATRWYLAEGSTTEFELFYLIFNPEAADAVVDVEYLLPGGRTVLRTYTAPADRRTTIAVNAAPGVEDTDVAAIITSRNGVPIVVERSMYRDSPERVWAAGDSGAGLTATATTWHLAEGATGTFFDTFVLIANPENTAAEIEARFRKGDGTVVTKAYTVAARSRFTIWVDAADPALAATDVATTIVSTNGVGIVVERAMWWPGPQDAAALGTTVWSDSHLAAASPVTAARWMIADGAQGGAANAETYVLVANTSAAAGAVQVMLVFDDGSTLARNLPIAPSARLTIPIGTVFPEAAGRRFAVTVESAGPTPLALVVERASYSDAGGVKWAAGTAVAASPMP